MASIRRFSNLLVWQKAHLLVLEIYKVTDLFPDKEQFGLTSQLRRAAVSITSNIAEGFERGSNKDFARFLIMSRASIAETQNQLLLARDLGYLEKNHFDKLANQTIEVHKMLNGFLKTLQTSKLANLDSDV